MRLMVMTRRRKRERKYLWIVVYLFAVSRENSRSERAPSCMRVKNTNLSTRTNGASRRRRRRRDRVRGVRESLAKRIRSFSSRRTISPLPPSMNCERSRVNRTNPPSALPQLSQPPPATYTKVRNFGNFSRLREKRRRKKSVSISLLTSGAEGDFR